MDDRREIPRELDARYLPPEEIHLITRSVFANVNPRRSDLILVFGARGEAGAWDGAASLFREGLADRLLVSGGVGIDPSVEPTPEAHLIRRHLIDRGVPETAILTEERSSNTLENVLFSHELLRRLALLPDSILFYCKSHHSGRALCTLAKHFPGVDLSCATYDARYEGVQVSTENWSTNEMATRRVLAEYHRIRLYASRGDIEQRQD